MLEEAFVLWRGDPFLELQNWDDGRIEAGRLTELRLEAEELYVEAALRSGHFDEVLSKAIVMVKAAPLRERRWMLLARTQYQAGRQGDALGSLRRLRGLLDTELGLDPGPEVGELERAILQQDPSLAAGPAAMAPRATCPYPGLAAYHVGDAASFFGRDDDVAECLHRLRETSVLAVVGPSGSGKSSLVRAGVAASMTQDGHRVEVVTPGVHPMKTLVGVSHRAGTTLIVDQCEEVFSICEDEAERTAFLSALTERATTSALVLSLRADRLVDVATNEEFTRLVERGLFLIRAMGEPDLRRAIEGPANQAGLVVEPGLVDLLVHEVEHQPGALPLLSHVLSQTWERREGRTLTLAGYHASGGIRGAVAQSAEAIYTQRAP